METERIKIKKALKKMSVNTTNKFMDEVIREMFDAKYLSPMLTKILNRREQ